MNENFFYQRSEKVCLCKDVTEEEILNSIKNGNITVEAIADDTEATTGCGTCLPEVEKILKNSRYYNK
ncbi:MAG: (2Fe-2S)-binding protein [Spirochaetia bacterium]|nr:(2Fe-2S)-binding protein [Spirochaetia bacterium]